MGLECVCNFQQCIRRFGGDGTFVPDPGVGRPENAAGSGQAIEEN